jgi:hypothetical protein
MKKIACLFILGMAAAPFAIGDDTPPPAHESPSHEGMKDVRAACQGDVKKLCPGVQPGGGRLIACLKEHQDEVSDGCKEAIAKARQGRAS